MVGPEVVEWARERFGIKDFGPAVGIGWKDGELRAATLFNGYTRQNICMHVVSDGSKRWMRREYLKFCFRYPFIQLGVKRITGMVEASNLEARRFDEHLGFRLETVLPDAGDEGDLCVYVMYRHECRFLE